MPIDYSFERINGTRARSSVDAMIGFDAHVTMSVSSKCSSM
jgi:hypothetical protein